MASIKPHCIGSLLWIKRIVLAIFFYNTYSTNVNPLNSINSTRLYKEINWGEFRENEPIDFANVGKSSDRRLLIV